MGSQPGRSDVDHARAGDMNSRPAGRDVRQAAPINRCWSKAPTARARYTITLATDLAAITAHPPGAVGRSEVCPASGPGRALNGNLVLSEIRATAAPKADPAQGRAA